MLLTYVDESERGQRFYFIGALTVTTAALTRIESALNEIVSDAAKLHPSVGATAELHGRDIFQGECDWEGVPPRLRVRVCEQTISAIAESGAWFVLRGTDRQALLAKYPDPHPIHQLTLSHALEQVNNTILERHGEAEHTLVIADEHHAAEDSRRRFQQIRLLSGDGYSQTALTQLADVLYFGPSHHSRLLQAADMVTFFTNRILTVEETDPRARVSMEGIAERIASFTANRYVWVPKVSDPESTKPPA